MKVIGLTGGIGSGKTTVSEMLEELGAVVIDADKVGHLALEANAEIRREVIAAFGEDILKKSGQIDRKKLAQRVFGDAPALACLNRIMHPKMYNTVKAQLEDLRKQDVNVVILEASLLFEAGWNKLADEVWVTVAPEATIVKRIKKRSRLNQQEIQARIDSQLSEGERLKYANAVIDTDSSLNELKSTVRELWQKLQTRKI